MTKRAPTPHAPTDERAPELTLGGKNIDSRTMAKVESVTGPIDAGDLGTTLIHEHLRCWDEATHLQWPNAGTASEDPPYAVAPGDDYGVAVEAAKRAQAGEVKTICDPTAMFLGRDVEFMRRVAEETGLQVIPCTGIYTYDHLPAFFVSRDADMIAEMFVGDIENGCQGAEIKAAFIKVAADEPGVNENIEKLHRAAARASLQTGAPIMAHSRPASDTATRQLEIFDEEGVAPEKIQIAHCGDSADVDQIERILDKGVYAGLDRYGIEMYLRTSSGSRPRSRCSSAATSSGSSSAPIHARPSTGSRRP